jgi:PAS domain S-box-containing protein
MTDPDPAADARTEHSKRVLQEKVREQAEALQRLSQVFRYAADPMIIEDLSGVVLEVNDEVERLFGWRREELVGGSIKNMVPKHRHAQVDELLAACRRGESVRNVEEVHLMSNGEEIPILLTLSLLAPEEGEPDAIASIAKDLRKLKETERSLDESRAVAEMHRDVAYMANTACDLEEAVQFCLEKVVHYNGWAFGHAYFPADQDPEILVPAASHYAVEPERFRKFREETFKVPIKRGQGLPGRVFATGGAQWASHDVQAELADRRATMADDLGIATVAAFPILVGEQVVGVLEFFSDRVIEVEPLIEESMAAIGAQLGRVIERNQAEQELRESEARLRLLTEQLRDVVWMHDAETFEILYCNAAFERIFGRPRDILDEDPKAFLDSVHPRDRKRVRAAVERMLDGEDLDEEFRIVRPDGTVRWLRDRGFPMRNDTGRIYRFAGTAEDITQRKIAEEDVKRLEREISEAAEEERHRIAQDLHDSIGALLSTVNLRLKVLEEDLAEGRPLESDAIETITGLTEEASRQTRTLTRGLHPVGDDPEDLMASLRDLAASVRIHASMECRFRCSRPVRVENHHVANQLFRIAQEAVNNAVKHSGASRLSVGLRRNDEGTILFVKDNGKGLDLNTEDEQAVGLGLRILRHRAETIGATLVVARRKKGGTKLVCTLPPDCLDE